MTNRNFRSAPFALTLVIAFVVSACSPQLRPAPLSGEEVKRQARDAFVTYVADLNRRDYDKASLIYDLDPDFHWIERGGVQYANGADAATSLRSFEEQAASPSMTIDQVMVADLSPTSALISTYFTFAMVEENGEQQFSFDGWMSVAMVKKGERWMIASGQVGPGPQH